MALRGSIARRYAKALFSLAVDKTSDKSASEKFGKELDALAAAYTVSDDLRHALESPLFKSAEKSAVLAALQKKLKISPEVQRFMALLLVRGRLPHLPGIARAYRRLSDDRLQQIRGTITSAQPLSSDAYKRITAALGKRTGRTVILEAQVDPELLGGVVAKVGDLVLDGSIKSRIERLQHKILN